MELALVLKSVSVFIHVNCSYPTDVTDEINPLHM